MLSNRANEECITRLSTPNTSDTDAQCSSVYDRKERQNSIPNSINIPATPLIPDRDIPNLDYPDQCRSIIKQKNNVTQKYKAEMNYQTNRNDLNLQFEVFNDEECPSIAFMPYKTDQRLEEVAIEGMAAEIATGEGEINSDTDQEMQQEVVISKDISPVIDGSNFEYLPFTASIVNIAHGK